MTPLAWDGELSYKDSLFMSLLGITDRDERIGLILADLFWRYQCDPLAEEQPLSADEAARLLIGCIASRGVTEERAWGLADALLARLRPARTAVIQRLRNAGPATLYQAMTTPTGLHRYPREMAMNLLSMADRIQQHYGGDARNIWRYPQSLELDGKRAQHGAPVDGDILLKRLQGFRGIGIKVATMTCRILLLDLGVSGVSRSLACLRPSPDSHVLRVAQRLGLISRDASPVAAVEQLVSHAERSGRMAVEYDGMYTLGSEVCHTAHPDCEEACPLQDECLYANYRDPRDLPESSGMPPR